MHWLASSNSLLTTLISLRCDEHKAFHYLLFPEHCDHMAEIDVSILLLALFTRVSPELITRGSYTSCGPPWRQLGGPCFIKNIEYHIIIFPTLYASLDQYIYSTPYCAPIIFNCWWRWRWTDVILKSLFLRNCLSSVITFEYIFLAIILGAPENKTNSQNFW